MIEETMKDGAIVRSNIWYDTKFGYISYYLPVELYGDKTERQLIELLKPLDSFKNIPAEYTRQAGISEIDDENGNLSLEISFSLGNKD